jgi:hypothetical protein
MIDYSKIDPEELAGEIYYRQMDGFGDRVPRITRITCRCCTHVTVFLHWETCYRPKQALPCMMCGRRPILIVKGSCHVGDRVTRFRHLSCWIYCEHCLQQEFSAQELIRHPQPSTSFTRCRVVDHTALQLIGRWNQFLRNKIKSRQL